MVLAGVCSLYFSPPLDAREREDGRLLAERDNHLVPVSITHITEIVPLKNNTRWH